MGVSNPRLRYTFDGTGTTEPDATGNGNTGGMFSGGSTPVAADLHSGGRLLLNEDGQFLKYVPVSTPVVNASLTMTVNIAQTSGSCGLWVLAVGGDTSGFNLYVDSHLRFIGRAESGLIITEVEGHDMVADVDYKVAVTYEGYLDGNTAEQGVFKIYQDGVEVLTSRYLQGPLRLDSISGSGFRVGQNEWMGGGPTGTFRIDDIRWWDDYTLTPAEVLGIAFPPASAPGFRLNEGAALRGLEAGANRVTEDYVTVGVPTLGDIPDIFAWYDISDAASRTMSGANITLVNDKTGSNNLTVSGALPLVAANSGLNAADYGTQVGSALCDSTGLYTGTAMTTIAVCKANTSPPQYQRIVSVTDNSHGADYDNVPSANTIAVENYAFVGGTRSFGGLSYKSASFGSWHVIFSVFDGTNHTMWVDGVAGSSVSCTGTFIVDNVGVGCRAASTRDERLSGAIGEVALVGRAMTSTEIADNTTLLLQKWFAPPAAPTAVAGSPSGSSVWLTWAAPASDLPITDYVVQHALQSAPTSWTTFTDAVSIIRSAMVTGLTPGTAYVFRVAAVSVVGTGAYSSASAAVTPTSGGLVYTDDFNRADSNATRDGGVGLGDNWLGESFGILSNKATKTSGGSDWITFLSDLGSIDHWVEVDMVANNYDIINARRPANNDAIGYLFWIGPGAGQTAWALGRTTAGGYSLITSGNAAVAHNGSAKIRLECEGTNIRGYINGVEVVNVTNSDITANTRVGFNQSGSGTYDNFRCGPLPYTAP